MHYIWGRNHTKFPGDLPQGTREDAINPPPKLFECQERCTNQNEQKQRNTAIEMPKKTVEKYGMRLVKGNAGCMAH